MQRSCGPVPAALLPLGLLALAVAASGCARPAPNEPVASPAAASPVATTAVAAPPATYPAGLDSRHPARDYRGVYPSADAASCCWLQKTASLVLRVPADAKRITLRISLPGVYKPVAQSIGVAFDGAKPLPRRAFTAPVQDVAFPVPAAARGKAATLHVDLAQSFVPAKLGLSGDTREFSVVLHGIAFE